MAWKVIQQKTAATKTNPSPTKEKEVEVSEENPIINLNELTRNSLRHVCNAITNKIFKCERRSQIIYFCMDKFFVSESVAQELIDLAIKKMKPDIEMELENERDLALIRRFKLYEEATDVGDYRAALEILKDIAKLRGIYASSQTTNQHDILIRLMGGVKQLAEEQVILLEGDEYDEDEESMEEIEANIEDETFG